MKFAQQVPLMYDVRAMAHSLQGSLQIKPLPLRRGLVRVASESTGRACRAPKGGYDLVTALLDDRGTCGFHGGDAGQKLVNVREMLATQVVDAFEQLERPAV